METLNSSGTETKASPPASPEPQAGKLHLGKLWLGAAVILIIALLVGLVPRWNARASLRQENTDLAISYVNVVQAGASAGESSLLLPGEVRPFEEAPIYARTSGYLKRWLVDIGKEVKQGELLAEIDNPELNQQLAQARAQLLQAEASLELAKTSAARWQELLKTSSVSEQEVQEKTAALATGSANVEAARANVHRLEELQSFERVVAPFDGTITARRTDVGQLISADGGRELFHLAQMRTLRVFVRVPQASSQVVVPGMAADLRLAEKPGRAFAAKVVRTAGAIDSDSRTLLAELEVNNEQGEILAGSYAQVQFQLPVTQGSLVVPANTLLFRAEGPQVGVVDGDGRVDLRSVTLGRDFGTSLEVLAGVKATDQIILNPSDSLAAGATVRVVAAKAEEKAK
jgi:membrane fusion protein (multidrug efflux system)